MGVQRIRQTWYELPDPPIARRPEILAVIRRWWRAGAGARLLAQTVVALALLTIGTVTRYLPGQVAAPWQQGWRWAFAVDYGLRDGWLDSWTLWQHRSPEWMAASSRGWAALRTWVEEALTPRDSSAAPVQDLAQADATRAPSTPSAPSQTIGWLPIAGERVTARPAYVILDRPDAVPVQGATDADTRSSEAQPPDHPPTATDALPILSPFGWLTGTAETGPQLHEGVDLRQALGSAVLARRPGKVAAVSRDPRLGMVIQVDSPGVLSLRYAPLTDVAVRLGDMISNAQVLGMLAPPPPGDAGEPHLHLEAWVQGRPVDPVPILLGVRTP